MAAVHVDGAWLHALPTVSADAASDWALLDAAEQARARRFVQAAHAAAYVATHAALRRLLAPAAPAALIYERGPHGKPAVAGGPAFSLSHCPGHAWVALSTQAEVGLDIERLRPLPGLAQLAQDVMHPSEHAAWQALPQAAQLEAFLRLWTRKEAALKCLGVGLSRAPASLVTHWAQTERLPGLPGLTLHTASYNDGLLLLSLALAPRTSPPVS